MYSASVVHPTRVVRFNQPPRGLRSCDSNKNKIYSGTKIKIQNHFNAISNGKTSRRSILTHSLAERRFTRFGFL